MNCIQVFNVPIEVQPDEGFFELQLPPTPTFSGAKIAEVGFWKSAPSPVGIAGAFVSDADLGTVVVKFFSKNLRWDGTINIWVRVS